MEQQEEGEPEEAGRQRGCCRLTGNEILAVTGSWHRQACGSGETEGTSMPGRYQGRRGRTASTDLRGKH